MQPPHAASAAGPWNNFVRVSLPFDPTVDFHEYRVDHLPGLVVFYADGEPLARMSGPAVPTSPGRLMLRHWSNGDPHWSGGPPEMDATVAVRYVKAYFNSSGEQRQEDWARRCLDRRGPGSVCEVPDVRGGNHTAGEWFFSKHGNMTNNQTVNGTGDDGRSTSHGQRRGTRGLLVNFLGGLLLWLWLET